MQGSKNIPFVSVIAWWTNWTSAPVCVFCGCFFFSHLLGVHFMFMERLKLYDGHNKNERSLYAIKKSWKKNWIKKKDMKTWRAWQQHCHFVPLGKRVSIWHQHFEKRDRNVVQYAGRLSPVFRVRIPIICIKGRLTGAPKTSKRWVQRKAQKTAEVETGYPFHLN